MNATPMVMWQCEIEDNGLVWSKHRKAFVPAAGQHQKPVEDLAKEFWFFKEEECDEVCRALASLGVTSQSVRYALDNTNTNESGEGDEHEFTGGAAGADGQVGDGLPVGGP